MTNPKHLLLFALTIISFCFSFAQAPPTIEDALKTYGVQPTVPALRSALRNKRAEVRRLAAGQLRELKDTASVPFIIAALERERNSTVRFNMATSLLSLGSPVGRTELIAMCDDSAIGDDRRLNAASALVDAGEYACLPSIENVLSTTQESSTRAAALLILSRVQSIPSTLMPATHDLLIKNLVDPVSAVRQYASECIAVIGDKAAAPNLQAAINVESDVLTKQQMERALQALEGKP